MPHDDPYAGKTIDADWAYYTSVSTAYAAALTATTTNPNLGADGTSVGSYHRNGHSIIGFAQFFFSGAGLSAGSGAYQISLPFNADTSIMVASTTVGAGAQIGTGFLRDSDTSANHTIVNVQLASASVVRLIRSASNAAITNAFPPIAWATGDRISINFSYVADPAAL
jgi:hypothetical protein